MPFDKPRIFSGDGPENTDKFIANTQSALRSQEPLTRATISRATISREIVPDEELGLSAELKVLASHLRGEADALADRYAPETLSTRQSESVRPVARRWFWQCVAVGLAGLALLAWRIERWQASPPAAPVESVAQTATPANIVAAPPHQPMHVAANGPSVGVPQSPVRPSVVNSDPATLRHSQGIAEVGIDEPAVERHLPADQVEMLRIQALGFEKVIRKLQAELVARDTAQIESERQIQSLQEEVRELHKQLDDMRR